MRLVNEIVWLVIVTNFIQRKELEVNGSYSVPQKIQGQEEYIL